MTSKRALIIVDIQNDFLPGGALGVPDGDTIVPVINDLMADYAVVAATQDWHPEDHGSFAANHPEGVLYEVVDLHGLPQVLWPTHCVQGTEGAAFSPLLKADGIQKVFPKGTDACVDSYSGFFDNGKRGETGLDGWLREQGVDHVDVVGLALDYCVKATALHAAELGFKTQVLLQATRAVNVSPGDGDDAIAELKRAGVAVVESGAPR